MTKMITRFAPSPTGNLHIGSARTALINYICKSKNNDSKLYLRIEDTDKDRSKEEFKNNILSGLKWLGIDWDNEPQIQSHNINRHLEIANKLLENGKAFKCICNEIISDFFNKFIKFKNLNLFFFLNFTKYLS